ncbi:MAG: putative bifunctional diguanylate cyclase/phosphodiesterase, partial [Beijerinckiaceae bacterium]
PTSALAIDLDGFKHINDVFGHDIGDLLLKEAAVRITAQLSPQSVTARIGGDEFLVLSPELDELELCRQAEAIIASIGEPFIIRNVALRAGVSIGVVAGAGQQAEALLKEADLALYAAKDGGRNRACVFTPALRSSYDDRISLESDLRRAIEQGDITLAYQPIIDPDTRRATFAEALMRWTHATRGPVPPSVFVQVAETTGLITVLGAWVIQNACQEAARWPNDIGVSVNLSARQFRADHDLAAVVKAALARARLSPERLTLEITETAMFDDSGLVHATLTKIRKMGVKIALDDFGTGYSSLSYLAELPLDKLKIDRTFTTRIASSDRSYSLLKGVAALARDLGLDLIIEGVETSAQLDLLRGLGVDGVQGYVFAKAMPGEDFNRLCVSRFKPVDAAGETEQRRRALH